jgi:hypothetical protein
LKEQSAPKSALSERKLLEQAYRVHRLASKALGVVPMTVQDFNTGLREAHGPDLRAYLEDAARV